MSAWLAWLAGAAAAALLAAQLRLRRRLKRLAEALAEQDPGSAPALPRALFGGPTRPLAEAIARAFARDPRPGSNAAASGPPLSDILDGMEEGLIHVGADGRIGHLNRRAASFFDLEPGQAIGRPFWEVLRVPALEEQVRACLDEALTTRSELVLPRSGHRDLVLEVRSSPAGDAGGALVLLHDLTRLRVLEAARRDFVANASHELKTPVAAIRALVETVSAEVDSDPALARDYLARVARQVGRLERLIQDLIQLTRLEQRDGRPKTERVDAAALALSCAEAFEARANETGLEFRVAVPEGPLAVEAEPEALRAVLDNLLANAFQYTPPPGRVTLELTEAPGGLRITVADTGIGIEPRHHARIFERFFRVDPARSRRGGGTGLGLSIVKHAVQRHGGRIELQSLPGRGSTFTVFWPAGPRAAAPPASEAAQPKRPEM